MSKLNWYGQPLMEYQKSSCLFCLADVPHRAHVTELEAEQMDLYVPKRPRATALLKAVLDDATRHDDVEEPAA